ncbi:phosphonate ABC transporter, permease protein PhnE [Candidatus Entotheonella serta]|nr:phosphonate ABC transporter, permease protein PhnE [Candidatus Entotheonella serta]
MAFEQAQRQHRRSRRLHHITFCSLFGLALVFSCYVGEVSIENFVEELPGFLNYIRDITPQIRVQHAAQDIGEWYWGIGKWLKLLFDTVIMAFLGTLFGACGAFLICFSASRNLVHHTVIYVISRRLTELARAVPELVYAMIFVFSFGLGPFPGVLAIAIHSMGALEKLFSEVNENVDMRPLEGARAAAANWFQMIRFAVVPQVLPDYLSYTLLRFEINVRAAAVIGFVGAGGIGQELMFVIRQFVYADISAIVILIILSVALIDMVCERFRHRAIGST